MGVRMGVQAYRDISIGIGRRYLKDSESFEPDPEDQDEDEGGPQDENEAVDLQAGHTSHIAGMIYARSIHE